MEHVQVVHPETLNGSITLLPAGGHPHVLVRPLYREHNAPLRCDVDLVPWKSFDYPTCMRRRVSEEHSLSDRYRDDSADWRLVRAGDNVSAISISVSHL